MYYINIHGVRESHQLTACRSIIAPVPSPATDTTESLSDLPRCTSCDPDSDAVTACDAELVSIPVLLPRLDDMLLVAT